MTLNASHKKRRFFKLLWKTCKAAILVIVTGIALLGVYAFGGTSNAPIWTAVMTLSLGLISGGISSAFIEYYTALEKYEVMVDAFGNMALGVKVHRDHNDIISRMGAVELYLNKRNSTMYIMSPNATNYIDVDNDNHRVREAILKKCENMGCRVCILLNIPPPTYKKAGELTTTYDTQIQSLIRNIENYATFINEGGGRIEIKCLIGIMPLHFAAYDNERIFHGLTTLSNRDRKNPCIEVYPVGGIDHIYQIYIKEFRKLFDHTSDDHLILEFDSFKNIVQSWKNDSSAAANWYLSELPKTFDSDVRSSDKTKVEIEKFFPTA